MSGEEKQSPYDVEAISAGALLCHYRGKNSKVLQAKLQQQADRILAGQARQQGDETPTKHLLTMTWALILGPVVSFFVSKELFGVISVCSSCILPIFAVALVKSKNATAKATGVVILVPFIAACCAFFFLMANYD